MPEILLAQDDERLRRSIVGNLTALGFTVTPCKDAKAALEIFMARQNAFDACLFEAALPKFSGMRLTQQIRNQDDNIPVAILANKPTKSQIQKFYKSGADMYVEQPLNFKLLRCRLQPLLKRSGMRRVVAPDIHRIGNWDLDCNELLLSGPLSKVPHRLTRTEAALLKYLASNQNTSLERDDILQQVWGKNNTSKGRTMDVFICRIKGYFKDDPCVDLQHEVGKSYRLSTDDEDAKEVT